jgi:hypothetical protein
MGSPNDPDPGRFPIAVLWFVGWWAYLLFELICWVYQLFHPQSEWDYTMGGDL